MNKCEEEVRTGGSTPAGWSVVYILKNTLDGCLKNAEGRSRTGTWGEPHQILSLARLPIPSHRHIKFSKLQQLRLLKQKQIKIASNILSDILNRH